MDKTEFFLWLNADSGAYRQDKDIASHSIGSRFNLDPFLVYFDKNGNRHSLKGRYFRTTNSLPAEPEKNSNSDMFYLEYQYQKQLKNNLNWTLGAVGTYADIVAQLFGSHNTSNASVFTQFDKKFGLLNLSAGVRAEYFRIDKEETHTVVGTDTIKDIPIQPVFRLGANYQLVEHTFLRASFGQGYRFPTVAEKYTSTSVSLLNIFPNPDLKSETGWSAELGLKQGLKVSRWSGYFDIAGFWTEYHEMMEFTFGAYNFETYKPINFKDSADLAFYNANGFKTLGFQSINVGNARITGVDMTITGMGKIFGIPTTLLAGYTYTNPIDLNVEVNDSTKSTKSNILKYRNYHTVKADLQLDYKKISTGVTMLYYSNMINIDKAFEDLMGDGPSVGFELLPGLYEYRQKHNKGYIVFDYRIAISLTEHSKISLVIRNITNEEYMGRPGDMRPPRSISLQYVLHI